MILKECMAQAMRELGISEERIKDGLEYADKMAGKLAAVREVDKSDERPYIERFKAMYRLVMSIPGFAEKEIERVTKEIKRENARN